MQYVLYLFIKICPQNIMIGISILYMKVILIFNVPIFLVLLYVS